MPLGNDTIKKDYEGKQGELYKKRARNNKFPPEFLEKIIDEIPQGGKFLDAGCGTGVFLRQLIDAAKSKGREDIEFFAFDYTKEMAEETARLNPEAKVFCDDMKNLTSKISEQHFDYVLSMNVLFFFNPELGERELAFKNLSKLTSKDGILHISIREARFDKDESGSHFFDFTEDDLRTCMQEHGFKITSSEIGEKSPYGGARQANLDRFYNELNVRGVNIEKTPSPTLADSYSAIRAEALKNSQKSQGGSHLF